MNLARICKKGGWICSTCGEKFPFDGTEVGMAHHVHDNFDWVDDIEAHPAMTGECRLLLFTGLTEVLVREFGERLIDQEKTNEIIHYLGKIETLYKSLPEAPEPGYWPTEDTDAEDRGPLEE